MSYDKYEGPFRGRFGHLFYKEPFSHYMLRIEYRFVGEQADGGPGWAIRNSGVMIHGQTPETMRKDQEFPVSIEVQFLGGDGTNPRTTGNLCTPGTNVVYQGKLHTDHCTNSTSDTFHGDQWVTAEIEVHGGRLIRHKINGKTVLEYSEPQLDDRTTPTRKRLLDGGRAEDDHRRHDLAAVGEPPGRVPQGRADASCDEDDERADGRRSGRALRPRRRSCSSRCPTRRCTRCTKWHNHFHNQTRVDRRERRSGSTSSTCCTKATS